MNRFMCNWGEDRVSGSDLNTAAGRVSPAAHERFAVGENSPPPSAALLPQNWAGTTAAGPIGYKRRPQRTAAHVTTRK
jgi:hypothetical protein